MPCVAFPKLPAFSSGTRGVDFHSTSTKIGLIAKYLVTFGNVPVALSHCTCFCFNKMHDGLQIAIPWAGSKVSVASWLRRGIVHEGEPTLKTVLILDDDLRFGFWLGHLLDAAAYSALPAKSVPDAMLLVRQLNLKVDVLVINLALAGAVDFIAALQGSHQALQVIGVLSDSAQVPNIPRVNALQIKSPVLNEIAKIEWLQCVHEVLAHRVAMVG